MELVRGRTLEQELDVRGPSARGGTTDWRRCLPRAGGGPRGRADTPRRQSTQCHACARRPNHLDGLRRRDGDGRRSICGGHRRDTCIPGPGSLCGSTGVTAVGYLLVGVLLFHLASGSYPFRGSNRFEIQEAQNKGQIRRLRDLRPDLPEGFVRVVERCLSVDPQQRYQTAGELETRCWDQWGSNPVPSPLPRPDAR